MYIYSRMINISFYILIDILIYNYVLSYVNDMFLHNYVLSYVNDMFLHIMYYRVLMICFYILCIIVYQ